VTLAYSPAAAAAAAAR